MAGICSWMINVEKRMEMQGLFTENETWQENKADDCRETKAYDDLFYNFVVFPSLREAGQSRGYTMYRFPGVVDDKMVPHIVSIQSASATYSRPPPLTKSLLLVTYGI